MDTTKKPASLPGYDRICDQFEDAAHRGTSISVAAAQMLLETAETYAQLVQALQQRIDAMEPLLLEVIVHLRIQPHFSKGDRLSLLERAEKALSGRLSNDSQKTRKEGHTIDTVQEGDVVKVIVDGKVSEVYNDEQCLVTIHGVDVSMLTSQLQHAGDIEDMLIDALFIDDAHHKQWYLYQIAVKFGLDVGSITHDQGVAP